MRWLISYRQDTVICITTQKVLPKRKVKTTTTTTKKKRKMQRKIKGGRKGLRRDIDYDKPNEGKTKIEGKRGKDRKKGRQA